jgi:hypothetical protein
VNGSGHSPTSICVYFLHQRNFHLLLSFHKRVNSQQNAELLHDAGDSSVCVVNHTVIRRQYSHKFLLSPIWNQKFLRIICSQPGGVPSPLGDVWGLQGVTWGLENNQLLIHIQLKCFFWFSCNNLSRKQPPHLSIHTLKRIVISFQRVDIVNRQIKEHRATVLFYNFEFLYSQFCYGTNYKLIDRMQ